MPSSAAVVLLLAYLFGGYVAGRMARRAGLIHGLAMVILALVIVALIAAIAATQTDTSAIRGNLRGLGIPTTGAEWSDVGTLAGIGSLVAMLVGALLGGMLGERWHTKLTRRGASPKYGPDRDQPTWMDGRPRGTGRAFAHQNAGWATFDLATEQRPTCEHGRARQYRLGSSLRPSFGDLGAHRICAAKHSLIRRSRSLGQCCVAVTRRRGSAFLRGDHGDTRLRWRAEVG